MTQAYLDEVANQNDFICAERVSAKTGDNVNFAISKIVREVLMRVYVNEGGNPNDKPNERDLKRSAIGYQDAEGMFDKIKIHFLLIALITISV